ncbi:MAG: dTDP-4-dehydrorhamnose reductase [Anaerolineales bacterium]
MMRTKLLLLGNTGQLGWELNRTLLTLGEVVAIDYPDINMADPASIRQITQDVRPNIILNATAYTNVDQAESEQDLAMAINGTGPGVLAEEAHKLDAFLIHYSTDFVFDGRKGEAYTEDDSTHPINVYGETKLAGEIAIQNSDFDYLILRTSWVYSLRRPCFVTKVLEWARQREVLRIVDDQVSTPTWSRTLAETTAQIIAQGKGQPLDYLREKSGLYHLADSGLCSRYEWAQAIIKRASNHEELLVKEIQPAKSSEFPTPARRPVMSPLICTKFERTFGISMPLWDVALFEAFQG